MNEQYDVIAASIDASVITGPRTPRVEALAIQVGELDIVAAEIHRRIITIKDRLCGETMKTPMNETAAPTDLPGSINLLQGNLERLKETLLRFDADLTELEAL